MSNQNNLPHHYVALHNKFKEIGLKIENSQTKKVEKLLLDFEKNYFPPDCPPFALILHALIEALNFNREKCLWYLRQITPNEKFDDDCFQYYLYSCQIMDQQDLIEKLYSLKKDYAYYIELLAQYLTVSRFQEAQKMAKMIADQTSKTFYSVYGIVFQGICCACNYFLVQEKFNKIFAAFALNYFEKSFKYQADLIEIVTSLDILLGKTTDAISRLQLPEVQQAFSFNPLFLERLKIKCYADMKQYSEAGSIAEHCLKDIEPDSLDEWDSAIQYCENIDQIISEIEAQYPKYRGPSLAKIKLSIQRNEDPIPNIISYIQKYPMGEHVFGDLQPFLTPPICQALSEQLNQQENSNIKQMLHPSIYTFVFNDIPFKDFSNIQNGNDCLIFTQKLLLTPTATNQEYINLLNFCTNYEQPDARLAAIIIAGKLGLTAFQREMWKKQKLEGIHNINLVCLLINPFINHWDLINLKDVLHACSVASIRSLVMTRTKCKKAIESTNYLSVLGISRFYQQMTHNLSSFFSHIGNDFFKCLTENVLSQYPDIRIEKTKERFSEINEFIEKIDKSAIPLYFSDPSLDSQIFSSIFPVSRALNHVFRIAILITLKINDFIKSQNSQKSNKSNTSQKGSKKQNHSNLPPKDTQIDLKPQINQILALPEVDTLLKELSTESGWSALVPLVHGQIIDQNWNSLQLAAGALLIKVTHQMDIIPQFLELIDMKSNEEINSLKQLNLPETLADAFDNQIKTINESVEMIRSYLSQ